MLPKTHIILGAIFSAIILLIFQITIIESILIFLASFLIDVDHYLFYVFREKNYSLKKAYTWHGAMEKNHRPIMHIFHSIEFLILLGILSFFWKDFLFILIGILFHSALDIGSMLYDKNFAREMSLLRYLIRDKKNYF